MPKELFKRQPELMRPVSHTPIPPHTEPAPRSPVPNVNPGDIGDIVASRLYTTHEVAAFLGISHKTLECWRWKGSTGPRYRKLSRLVRYPGHELTAWLDSRVASSTTDTEGGGNE